MNAPGVFGTTTATWDTLPAGGILVHWTVLNPLKYSNLSAGKLSSSSLTLRAGLLNIFLIFF